MHLVVLLSPAEGEAPGLAIEQRLVEDLHRHPLLLAGLLVHPTAELHLRIASINYRIVVRCTTNHLKPPPAPFQFVLFSSLKSRVKILTPRHQRTTHAHRKSAPEHRRRYTYVSTTVTRTRQRRLCVCAREQNQVHTRNVHVTKKTKKQTQKRRSTYEIYTHTYLRRGTIAEISDALVLVDLLQKPVRRELDRRRHGLSDLSPNVIKRKQPKTRAPEIYVRHTFRGVKNKTRLCTAATAAVNIA